MTNTPKKSHLPQQHTVVVVENKNGVKQQFNTRCLPEFFASLAPDVTFEQIIQQVEVIEDEYVEQCQEDEPLINVKERLRLLKALKFFFIDANGGGELVR